MKMRSLTSALLCLLSAAKASFLLISAPTSRNVSYVVLPSFRDLIPPPAQRVAPELHTLIDGAGARCTGDTCDEASDLGLQSPEGIAVFSKGANNAVLYISDTAAESIFAYDVRSEGGRLRVGGQLRAARNIAGGARSLAVDSFGNLFLTTATDGNVEMLAAADLERLNSSAAGVPGRTVLYDAGTAVSSPGSIAADNMFVYWANTDGAAGAVVQAYRGANVTGASVNVLANNTAEASGICVARDNVFFSDGASLFAVTMFGGGVREVLPGLQQPGGCAFDGQNTLYVADPGSGGILSLPVGSVQLRPLRQATRLLSVSGPSQLAVVALEDTNAARARQVRIELVLLLLAAFSKLAA